MSYFEWPKTVKEWRDRGWKPDGSRPYDLWKREPLQKFFQDHGYTLWISEYEQGLGDIYNVQLHPPMMNLAGPTVILSFLGTNASPASSFTNQSLAKPYVQRFLSSQFGSLIA